MPGLILMRNITLHNTTTGDSYVCCLPSNHPLYNLFDAIDYSLPRESEFWTGNGARLLASCIYHESIPSTLNDHLSDTVSVLYTDYIELNREVYRNLREDYLNTMNAHITFNSTDVFA